MSILITDGNRFKTFIDEFTSLSVDVYQNAINKGFYEDGGAQNLGERIALMHQELSEALEAVRKGNPPDSHIPEFSGLEAELADVVIRAMDFAIANKLRLGKAIVEKHIYNTGRPHKHGKKF